MNLKLLFQKFTGIKPKAPILKGIPTYEQIELYNSIFFQSVKKTSYELGGKEATIVDAIKAQLLHGNVLFIDSFPDIYRKKDQLGPKKYLPKLKVLYHSHYANYVHDTAHIRSNVGHMPISEWLVVPDELYSSNTTPKLVEKVHKGKKLCEITDSIRESDLGNYKKEDWIQNQHIFVFEYTDKYYKSRDVDNELFCNKYELSKNYFTQPQTGFEKQMSANIVRAVFMDEKFKYYGSSQESFYDTAVNVSSSEPADIIFSSKEEDREIKAIHHKLLHEGKKGVNQMVMNDKKNSHTERIASNTANVLMKYI